MLRSLHIRDYALIEELEVEFDSGLNIITGETGAGKSILLGALKMILGERASMDVIRTGAKKAVIEGIFDNVDAKRIFQLLEENEIESSAILILRREITPSYSRGFINDTPATLQLMKEVAENVIDLHGQHEHQSLLRIERHLELLDNFGSLGGLLNSYGAFYQEMMVLQQERKTLVKQEKQILQQKELYEFQIKEIDAVNPQPDEEESLEAERRILENAEHLYETTANLYQLLYDSEGATYDQLVVARNELTDLVRIDSQFQEMLNEVKSAEIIIAEITKFLQDYNARIEFNPERLEAIRQRMGELVYLAKKYGGTLDTVLAHRAEIGRIYEVASDFSGAINRLDTQIKQVQQDLSEAAQRLSLKRRETAARIEQAISEELEVLGISNAQFHVHFSQLSDVNGWIQLPVANHAPACYQAFPHGMDNIEFFISTNLGERPKPLAKVASGGEISRIMLALKTILAKSERLPILVFDEIDTGISGRIASTVGESMHKLGQYHQIIAITHLPQIAARGDVHYKVTKTEEAGRTRTAIQRLTQEERINEVASLISGTAITGASLQSAKELMEGLG